MSEDQFPGTGSENRGLTRREVVQRGAIGAIGLASLGSMFAVLSESVRGGLQTGG
jgi:hypothetical protein